MHMYGRSFELPQLVKAIQMSSSNIIMYKYTGCYLKITKLLDCMLIGVFVVIRLNMVCYKYYPLNAPKCIWSYEM